MRSMIAGNRWQVLRCAARIETPGGWCRPATDNPQWFVRARDRRIVDYVRG